MAGRRVARRPGPAQDPAAGPAATLEDALAPDPGEHRRHRTILLVALTTTVLATFPFVPEPPGWSDPSFLGWLGAMLVLIAASLSGRFDPALRGIGPAVVVGLILWLVAMTGGWGSPYNALHVPVVAFMATFRETPAFLAILTLAAAAVLAPGLAAGDADQLAAAITAALAIAGPLVIIHRLATHQRRANRLYLSALERHAGPAYVVTADGRLRWVNGPAEPLLGKPLHDAVGTPWTELLAPGEAERIMPAFVAALAGQPQSISFVTDTPAGNFRLQSTVLPIHHGSRVVALLGLTEDVTEMHAATFDVRALRRALDHVSSPVALYDADTCERLYANAASWELAAVDRPVDRTGRPRFDQLRPELRRGVPESGSTRRISVVVSTDDDRALDVIIERLDVGRQVVAFTGTDVSARAEREASLRRLADAERTTVEELRRLNRLKDAFLTAVSHDLRTPLTVVIGAAKTLRRLREHADPVLRAQLEDALAAHADRLFALVTDLLDVDRLSRGVVSADSSTFDIVPLVHELIEEVGDPQRTRVEGPPRLQVHADEVQVERIVANLLENTVKYAPEGAVVVRVSGRPRGGLHLQVADEGPGIPEKERERVFQPFHRINLDDPQPGSGLGLALVAEFAAIHGGRAWVEPVRPRGTVAVVELPGSSPSPAPAGGAGDQDVGEP